MRISFLTVFVAIVCSVSSMKAQEVPFIVAHRGASYDAPENTLPAFELAWERKADAIEGDFYLTKDNQIVCIHDASTKAYSDKDLVVAKSALSELRSLDVGKYKNKKFAGTKIPTIAEVFATIPKGKKIFVEIKCGPEIVPFLEKEIDKAGLAPEQVVVIAFDSKVIKAFKKARPKHTANWLVGFKRKLVGLRPTTDTVLETLREIDADGFSSSKNATQKIIETIKSKGYPYHVWTVNDRKLAKQLSSWGVKSITTDRPLFIRQAFEKESR